MHKPDVEMRKHIIMDYFAATQPCKGSQDTVLIALVSNQDLKKRDTDSRRVFGLIWATFSTYGSVMTLASATWAINVPVFLNWSKKISSGTGCINQMWPKFHNLVLTQGSSKCCEDQALPVRANEKARTTPHLKDMWPSLSSHTHLESKPSAKTKCGPSLRPTFLAIGG